VSRGLMFFYSWNLIFMLMTKMLYVALSFVTFFFKDHVQVGRVI
jgi:hypothetical protein